MSTKIRPSFRALRGSVRFFKRFKWAGLIGFMAIGGFAIAYASGLLTISNTLNVNTPSVNLFAQVVASTVCPTPPGGYTDNALTMSWTVTQGSSQTQDVCVYNSGNASSHNLAVTFNPGTSSGITMSFSPNPATLNGNTPLLVSITLTASSTATAGSGSTTTIS